jgi:HicA-like toxin of HicAB toxin-antitoxin system
VSALAKLKRKLEENPRGIRFPELVQVLQSMGYVEVRSRGSHCVFRPSGPGLSILLVKPHAGRVFCAEVDVKRVLALLEEQEAGDE